MKINTTILFLSIVALMVMIAGCAQQEETVARSTEPASPSEPAAAPTVPEDEAEPETEVTEEETVTSPTEDSAAKEFEVIARNWEFVPSTITVNKGDTVTLHLKSEDVTHGFLLSAFNVRETLAPGERVDVTFVANKQGTFSFICSVFCGSGHDSMSGKLVVK